MVELTACTRPTKDFARASDQHQSWNVRLESVIAAYTLLVDLAIGLKDDTDKISGSLNLSDFFPSGSSNRIKNSSLVHVVASRSLASSLVMSLLLSLSR